MKITIHRVWEEEMGEFRLFETLSSALSFRNERREELGYMCEDGDYPLDSLSFDLDFTPESGIGSMTLEEKIVRAIIHVSTHLDPYGSIG